MPPTVLLSGFEPFGGERVNPARETACRLEGKTIDGLEVKMVRLPVDCSRVGRAQ